MDPSESDLPHPARTAMLRSKVEALLAAARRGERVIDPRIEALLLRYPDGLSDEELREVEQIAETDAEVDARMDALLDADSRLRGDGPAPQALSEIGQARLRRALQGAQLAPRAWSAGPATPTEAKVVPLFARARPALMALAAAVCVGLGFYARALFQPDAITIKGTETKLTGRLELRAAGLRLESGTDRAATDPVQFHFELSLPAHLALLETQGGRSFVLWPEPGTDWAVPAGPGVLQPTGSSPDYQPRVPGTAEYTLIGAENPLRLDAAELDADAILATNPGASMLARTTIGWR